MGRSVKYSHPDKGFTLIELLIVVIIIAMAATAVSFVVSGEGEEEGLRKEAETFFLSAQYLSEQAVFRGETYGLFVYPHEDATENQTCYLWQRVRDAEWQPLEELPERCLPPEFRVEITVDEQLWEYDDSLEYHDPVMGLYPSGEGSALVSLKLYAESDSLQNSPEESISLSPAGELRWVTEEERLEASE